MKAVLTLIFMLFIVDKAFSQLNSSIKRDRQELYDNRNPDRQGRSALLKQSEIYLADEALINQFNRQLGLDEGAFYTFTDNHRLSFAYHINFDLNDAMGVNGFEINYVKRLNNFQRSFWSLIYKSHTANFSQVSQNPTEDNSRPPTSDRFPGNQRPDDAAQKITTMGIGYAHRFKLILDFFPTQKVFEQINVNAGYTTLNDAHSGSQYKGYGFMSDYEIIYRSSQKLFYGLKFSYNLFPVSRAPLEGEASTDHKLTLSWVSMAFNIGYYF